MVKTASKSGHVRIAVIGVGGWGKNHARVLHDLGVLAAVCDVSDARAKEVASTYESNYYLSLSELFTNERDLDACLVCTPTKTHLDVAKRVIHNVCHVFV
jgi:UDP-N-acetylglucosamine 3-dehydrogenase